MKFSIKDFFIKCGQIRKKLRIWSLLLKKSLMENFIFSAVISTLHEEKVEFSRSIKKDMVLKQFLEVLFKAVWIHVKMLYGVLLILMP